MESNFVTDLKNATKKFSEWAKTSHDVLEVNGTLRNATDAVNELNELLKSVKLNSKTEK